jgi:ribose transport system permease protein
LFVVFTAFLGLTIRDFISFHNIQNVLITGGIDLSIPPIMAFAGIVGSLYMGGGGNPIVGALLMVVIGLMGGAVNGVAVAFLGMIPFVVTLATQAIAIGACVMVTQSVSVVVTNESFLGTVMSSLWGIPAPVILLFALTAIITLFARKSVPGRALYAVGVNAETARVSGISTRGVIFGAYAFSGLFAGIAAIVTTARLTSASATLGQEGVVLSVVGAAVVGGVSIYGGAGSFGGAVLGAIIITMISNAMNLAHLSYYATLIVKGLVIVTFVAIDTQSKEA